MRILFIGDIVGRSGRTVVIERLPGLVRDWKLDFVVVNGENAAGGFGITEAIYQELLDAGADAITLGNHAWDQKEALVFIERAPQADPADQLSAGTPGRGAALIEAQERRARAGRSMPWAASSWIRSTIRSPRSSASLPPVRCKRGADAIIVDMHAEATSEKQAMGHFCDGRASLVVGTHTHVPTADHQILPGGTAFISDVGMTGDYDSVIGMAQGGAAQRASCGEIPAARFEPADGAGDACAASRWRPTMRPGWRGASAPVRLGGMLEEARPRVLGLAQV